MLRGRIEAALWSSFIGDALSMPVHWYYDPTDIQSQYGRITDFQTPSDQHPHSIMNVANTGKGGRGDQRGTVIGDVILHDKRRFWGQKGVHYHRGMAKGENTLNLQCLRVLMRSIVSEQKYSAERFLADYVTFMTTPGTHNDTYAESFHRDFFSNYAKGVEPSKCAGEEGHDTPSIGGMVMLSAVIFLHCRDRQKAKAAALEQLKLTHLSSVLSRYVEIYADLLLDILWRDADSSLESILESYAEKIGISSLGKLCSLEDTYFIGRVVSSACYIDHSFPCVLFLVRKYCRSLEDCLIGNTNAGGENCHRGAVVGTLIGAGLGMESVPVRWMEGLHSAGELREEIDGLLDLIVGKEEVKQ